MFIINDCLCWYFHFNGHTCFDVSFLCILCMCRDDPNAVQPVASMPGVSRYGINRLKEALDPIVKKGLKSILLFGVAESLSKVLSTFSPFTVTFNQIMCSSFDNSDIFLQDAVGSNADSKINPVVIAIPLLKKWFPDLVIACDVI